jgi:thiosulfate dehydrogenase (quinone) large subunit
MSTMQETPHTMTASAPDTNSKEMRQAALPRRARPLAILRILLGSVFLWAFFDKTFGLGFATAPEKGWLAGGSPTAGYLGSLEGSFAGLFQSLAGAPVVDWAFMLGLLAVGTALVLGIALRAAAVGGTALMILMWLSSLPLKSNPVIDEHIVYAAAMIVLAATHAGNTFGLGRQWSALTSSPSLRWLR